MGTNRAKELVVQMVREGEPEEKRFAFSSAEGNLVAAGVLKQRFLSFFDETNVELETESVADEARSFHLLAFDDVGEGVALEDEAEVDLGAYSRFELHPRTTGGRGR